MAYTTTSPDHGLRAAIVYEDEAGYRWRRTDTSQPERIGRLGQLDVTDVD